MKPYYLTWDIKNNNSPTNYLFMKHLVVFPVFALLVIVSLLIGAVMWLYRFSNKDFRKGANIIHKHIKFTNWYEFSR